MTESYKITYGNEEEAQYVRHQLIKFNAGHVSGELGSRYEEIHLTVKDVQGRIVGGMLAVLFWNWIEVEIL